jgi:hypothetical protein
MRFARDPRSRLMVPDRRLMMAAPQQALLAGAGAAAPTDPYFSDVVLLLNPSAADGSTTFVDLSSYAHTLTTVGAAKHDTSIVKFTPSSLELSALGDEGLRAADHAALDLGPGSYTIEFWINFYNLGGSAFLAKRANAAAYGGVLLYIDGATSKVGLAVTADNASWGVSVLGSVPTPNVWSYVTVDYDGSNTRLYHDGAVTATVPGAFSVASNAAGLSIGLGGDDNSNGQFGYFGPLRITKGVARYAGAFTPPSAAFPTS